MLKWGASSRKPGNVSLGSVVICAPALVWSSTIWSDIFLLFSNSKSRWETLIFMVRSGMLIPAILMPILLGSKIKIRHLIRLDGNRMHLGKYCQKWRRPWKLMNLRNKSDKQMTFSTKTPQSFRSSTQFACTLINPMLKEFISQLQTFWKFQKVPTMSNKVEFKKKEKIHFQIGLFVLLAIALKFHNELNVETSLDIDFKYIVGCNLLWFLSENERW